MGLHRSVSRLLEDSRAAELTYAEVGATADEELPPGYGRLRRQAVVGHGPRDFQRAQACLMTWRMHTRAGVRVSATAPVAAPGTVVVLAAGVRPFQVLAPCRVVYLVSEAHRQGFAYGTLPGHPEIGEESFVVQPLDDGTVVLDIRAFSRPGAWYARLGGPLTRLTQRLVIERYVSALSRDTRQQRHPPAADT